MKKVLIMDPEDNVANALDDIAAGEAFVCEVAGTELSFQAADQIPYGFKVAVRNIGKGETIWKYHQPIGKASVDIKPGECVHIHNVEGARGRGDQEGKA